MYLCSITSSLCSLDLQSPADFSIIGHRCVEAEIHLKVPGDLNLKIPGLDVESLVSSYLAFLCSFFSYVLHLFLSASLLHFFLKSFSSFFLSVAWFVYLPLSLLSSFLMSFLPSLCFSLLYSFLLAAFLSFLPCFISVFPPLRPPFFPLVLAYSFPYYFLSFHSLCGLPTILPFFLLSFLSFLP